jgi:uncharacterized membrane protein
MKDTPRQKSPLSVCIGNNRNCLLICSKKQKTKKHRVKTKQNIFQLMLAGTSLGMTSIFYYLAVKYIPVSIELYY